MAFEKQIEQFEQDGKGKKGKSKKPAAPSKPQAPKRLSEKQKEKIADKKEQESVRSLLEEERIYQRGIVSIRDLIAPASFEVTSSFLKLGDLYARTLFIVAYPRYVGVGWAAGIINFNWTIDISMYFYPIKAAIILKQLKKKAGEVEAQLSLDRQKGKP